MFKKRVPASLCALALCLSFNQVISFAQENVGVESVEEWVTESQESSSQATSETTTTESQEADNSGDQSQVSDEASSDQASVYDVAVNEDKTQNQAFLQAYADYKQIVEKFDFTDAYEENDQVGTSLADFQAQFEPQVEGQQEDLSETEAVIQYVYQDGTEEGTDTAELIVYFSNDQLVYAGIAMLVDHEAFSPDQLISNDQLESWLSQDALPSFEDIAQEAPRVMGLSYMEYQTKPINMMMVPTGDSLDEMTIDFMCFWDGQMLDSVPEIYEEAFNQPNPRMLAYTTTIIRHVILGEPLPEANNESQSMSSETESDQSEE